jgi:hypothetical protein
VLIVLKSQYLPNRDVFGKKIDALLIFSTKL